jgi:hypothetical protein
MFGFDLFEKYFFGIFNMKRKQKTEDGKRPFDTHSPVP